MVQRWAALFVFLNKFNAAQTKIKYYRGGAKMKYEDYENLKKFCIFQLIQIREGFIDELTEE